VSDRHPGLGCSQGFGIVPALGLETIFDEVLCSSAIEMAIRCAALGRGDPEHL